jgi:hypothetical protein
MDRQVLIFLQIPKAVGTTLNRITERKYNPPSIFTIDPYRICATTKRFKTLSGQRRRRLGVVRGPLYFIPRRPLHRKLKKERFGVEDHLRLILHRPRLQCRLVVGVEETAVSGYWKSRKRLAGETHSKL